MSHVFFLFLFPRFRIFPVFSSFLSVLLGSRRKLHLYPLNLHRIVSQYLMGQTCTLPHVFIRPIAAFAQTRIFPRIILGCFCVFSSSFILAASLEGKNYESQRTCLHSTIEAQKRRPGALIIILRTPRFSTFEMKIQLHKSQPDN